jgi:predicted NBD/HSP70 family sugar kinase
MPNITGDQSLLKRINRMALVRLVKAQPGLSRVDLAKRTGLTKTTVGMLVQELIEEGWLRQNAPSEAQGVGRRPLPITLDPSRIGLLGADIGVDYLNVVACNLQGDLLFSRRLAYRHAEVNRSVKSLAALVARAHAVLVEQRRRPLGLGVGVPGMFDVRDGLLRFAPNLGWHEVQLEALIHDRLAEVGCGALSVSVMNEAKAAALSEYVFGAEHHSGPLVYLSMGIGLGAGIVLDDRLYLGNDGLAGEVGHTILQKDGPRCSCGRLGCAETFVSQRAISRDATGKDRPILSIEALAERVARGDKPTVRAAQRAGEYLGLVLQNLGNTVNPAVVVLGGPLCQLGGVFLDTAVKQMEAAAGKYDYHRHSIRTCRFGQNACAVGAAGSVFQHHVHSLGETPSASPDPTRSARRRARPPAAARVTSAE